jgi:hypothetical protein
MVSADRPKRQSLAARQLLSVVATLLFGIHSVGHLDAKLFPAVPSKFFVNEHRSELLRVSGTQCPVPSGSRLLVNMNQVVSIVTQQPFH